jgi:hypothetical protein
VAPLAGLLADASGFQFTQANAVLADSPQLGFFANADDGDGGELTIETV